MIQKQKDGEMLEIYRCRYQFLVRRQSITLFYFLVHVYFLLLLPHPHTNSIAGGEWADGDGYLWNTDSVLEFNKETETWSEVGHMMHAEAKHAVAVVNFTDFRDWCTFDGLRI